MSLLPIYTPGWKEATWSKVSWKQNSNEETNLASSRRLSDLLTKALTKSENPPTSVPQSNHYTIVPAGCTHERHKLTQEQRHFSFERLKKYPSQDRYTEHRRFPREGGWVAICEPCCCTNRRAAWDSNPFCSDF